MADSLQLSLRQEVFARHAAMKTERSAWESDWRDLADYVLPRRGRFTLADRNQGRKKSSKIVDSTATRALRILQAGLTSDLTSAAYPWFRLGTEDPDLEQWDPVKEWLYFVTQRLLGIFARSNFYTVRPIISEEIGLFGTAPCAILEDFQDVVRWEPYTAGEYWLALGPRQTVDTFYRTFSQTVRQVVQDYGLDRVSATVKNAWNLGNYNQWVEILWAVEPNVGRQIDKVDRKNKPWRSVYYELGANGAKLDTVEPLRYGGFDSFPLACPRWHVAGADIYGTSPAMEVLPDVKQLQLMNRRRDQGLEKIVSPPMVAPTTLRNDEISLLPGALNFHDEVTQGRGTFRPLYEVPPQIVAMQEPMQEVRERILSGFFADIFLMIAGAEDRDKTAFEVARLHEEKLLMLGPVSQRLHKEDLAPNIDRTFEIALRRGMFPPPPKELSNQTLRVEYESVLFQAQKLAGVQGLASLLSTVIGMAETVPEAVDNLDIDEAVRELGDRYGVRPKVIRRQEDVLRIRQSRAAAQQAQAAAQSVENLRGLTDAAHKASQTDTSGGRNLLNDVVGAMQ